MFATAVGGGLGATAAATAAAASTALATGAGVAAGVAAATAWRGVRVRLLGELVLVDTQGYGGVTPAAVDRSTVEPTAGGADEAADALGAVAEGIRESFHDTVEQLPSLAGGNGAAVAGGAGVGARRGWRWRRPRRPRARRGGSP